MRQQTATTINTNAKNYKAPKNHGIVNVEDLFSQKRGTIESKLLAKGIRKGDLDDELQNAMIHFIEYYDAERGENPLSFVLNRSVQYVVGRYHRNVNNRYETTVDFDCSDDEPSDNKIEVLAVGDITPDFSLAAARFMDAALETLSDSERAVFLAADGIDWHGLSKGEQEELAADCTRIYGREFTYQQIRRAVIGIRTKLEVVTEQHFDAEFKASKRATKSRKAQAQAECHA